MKKQAYQSKGGEKLFKPVMTETEARHLMITGDIIGWCLACGEEQDAEPDMERGHCESCGAMKVYGVEQLVLMGIAVIGNGKAEPVEKAHGEVKA